MNKLWMAIGSFLKDEEGVTAIEYGLIAALIAVAIIAMVALIGETLNNVFNCIAQYLQAADATTVTCAIGG